MGKRIERTQVAAGGPADGLGVFAGLLAYGDFRQVGRTLFESPAAYAGFAAAAGLAVVNYGLRYLRWSMYLRALGLSVPASVSVPVFVAGLALSITPGKVGELLKSVWLHQRTGVPVATSAPAVVMERLTDVISVALLGMTGALLLPPAVALAIGALLVIGLAVGLLAASRYGARALDLPVLRRWREPLGQSQDGFASPDVAPAASGGSGAGFPRVGGGGSGPVGHSAEPGR